MPETKVVNILIFGDMRSKQQTGLSEMEGLNKIANRDIDNLPPSIPERSSAISEIRKAGTRVALRQEKKKSFW